MADQQDPAPPPALSLSDEAAPQSTVPPSPPPGVAAHGNTFTSDPAIPDRIQGYTVVCPIASGGMGTVYRAEQHNPKRVVALKVIKPGMATPAALRRFEFEAQVLGHLHHPGIAQIFEAGTFDSGQGPQPFFAMEFVEGAPLNEYASGRALSIREKLDIITKICDAIEHAHQKGIIHRDLKPGNILVTTDGQPKLLDFGLARASGADGPMAVSMHTEAGILVGTLLYMSPEQARGDADEIDTRSDIYSLGVIAYELLAGALPYKVALSPPIAPMALLMAIIGEEAPPLSAVDRRYRGDIETTIAKALAKEKSRRYQSAVDLAEDIRRHLRDEPILARPPSSWYQATKFAKRNKTLVFGLFGVALALVLGLVATLWQAREARLQRDNALEARRVADQARSEAEAARAVAEERGAQLRRRLYVEQLRSASDAWKDREFTRLQSILLAQLPEPGAEDLRGFEWFHLWGESHRDPLTPHLKLDTSDLPNFVQAAFSPDGRTVAAANMHPMKTSVPGIVALYDASTGNRTGTLAGHTAGIPALAFSPDGKLLATASQDKTARVWDLATGQTLHVLEGHANWVASLAFSPDGKLLATGGGILTMDRPTEIMLWDVKTGKRVAQFNVGDDTGSVLHMVFNPAGDRLMTSIETVLNAREAVGVAKLWDVKRGAELSHYGGGSPVGEGLAMAISPDWKTLAEGGQAKALMLWDLATGTKTESIPGPADWISSMDFSPDGAALVMGSGNQWTGRGDGELLFWNPATWRQRFAPQRTERGVASVKFSPDGSLLAVGSMGSTLEVYKWSKPETPLGIDPPPEDVAGIALSPDDRMLALAWSEDPDIDTWLVGVWDTTEKKFVGRLGGLGPKPTVMAFSPDGATLAVSIVEPKNKRASGRLALWRWRSDAPPIDLDTGRGSQLSLAFSPDGATLAGGGERDHMIRFWNAATGEAIATLQGHKNPVEALSFSPDGARLASGSYPSHVGLGLFNRESAEQGELKTWDVASRKLILDLPAHADGIESIAYSPDGKLLATGGRDASIRLWDPNTGHPEGVLESRIVRWIRSIRFTKDGRTLIAGGMKGLQARGGSELAFWDLPTRRLRANFEGSQGVRELVYSSKGGFIAAALDKGGLQTWCAPTGDQIRPQIDAALAAR